MSEQRTPEWYERRRGKVTASCLGDVMAKGQGKTRAAYMVQVVCERLTGEVQQGYRNSGMDRGTEQEPYGVMAYEVSTGQIVMESGFVDCPEIVGFGSSPDGLIDDDGGLELKCPDKTHVHLDTIIRQRMPPEHRPQVQGNMLATGRQWWDFVSYDPRLPERLQLYIERIPRDEAYIATLRAEIAAFLADVDAMIEQLNRLAA